ncbi:MAG: hypothetical protein Q4Q04_05500 [Methanocorpusculum sp.]|nr:hypothetical protein [Methanocorpusculum sp.]
MGTLEELERKISLLEKRNDELEERVSDLELQTAQLTERALRSCSSCSMH